MKITFGSLLAVLLCIFGGFLAVFLLVSLGQSSVFSDQKPDNDYRESGQASVTKKQMQKNGEKTVKEPLEPIKQNNIRDILERKKILEQDESSNYYREEDEKERVLRPLIDKEWERYKLKQASNGKEIPPIAEDIVLGKIWPHGLSLSGSELMEGILQVLKEEIEPDKDILSHALNSAEYKQRTVSLEKLRVDKAIRFVRLVLRWNEVDKQKVRNILLGPENDGRAALLSVIEVYSDKDFIPELVKRIGDSEVSTHSFNRRSSPTSYELLWSIGKKHPREVVNAIINRVTDENLTRDELWHSVRTISVLLGQEKAIPELQAKMIQYYQDYTVCNRLLSGIELLRKHQ